MSAFKVISTFAGGGGSSTGYVMAGGKVLLAVEWDDNAVATYKANYPDTPVYHGDIAKLSVEEVLKRTGLNPGELDIFDGSPPCQGFSMAGKRDFADDRNQLFREYVRLLRGLQPKVFVMENVSGMVKGGMKVIFAEILQELKASGYKVSARLMNSMYFGVPQSRERMIFIGVREDLGIESSHPKPFTKPIFIKDALIGVKEPTQTEFMKISPSLLSYWRKCIPGNSLASVHPKRSLFNYIKLSPNKPCNTISKDVNLLHWSEERYMTIPEIKRLASYPDDYKFIGAFSSRWNRIGNSVPPLLMKSVATHIYENILQQTSN